MIPPQSELLVVAEAEDDLGVTSVELLWDFNGNAYPCPSSSTYVQCRVDGNRNIYTVTIGVEGPRPFRVRAVDTAGNETTTGTLTVEVQAK